MKIVFVIFIFLSPYAKAQQSAQWSTSKETYVLNYEVQRSTDQKTWATFQTILPAKKDTNYYICVLPLVTNYYRVKANMTNGAFYTSSIKLTTVVDAGADETVQLPNNINLLGNFSQN
jgi:hypothetical protein